MAPFANWVSSGVHQNASLDKLTLGKIAPEAKQAVASFPGEERGLWTLLLRAPPAYCERAFGEETVSLCPVYSYANDWWAAWWPTVLADGYWNLLPGPGVARF